MAAAIEEVGANPWSPTRRPGPPARPVYSGGRWRLFGLALSRMALTILTLGIGRFWMTTRLRRHYWSSLRIDGDPLEYTGRAGEKLIGFLVAVVILAVYLSLANLALTFIGLSWIQGSLLGLQLPLLAVPPALFWARYRARRYILARTRWRGVRFGLAPGAWGYAGRSLLLWGLTLLTLGLTFPLTQHRLARYTTDRTFFGDLRFEQKGGAGPLFRSWLLFWVPSAALALVLGVAAAQGGRAAFETPVAGAIPLVLLALAGLFLRHQVFSFRHLNGLKTLGGRTWFTVELGFWRVMAIHLSGWLATGFGTLLAAAIAGFAGAAGAAAFGLDLSALERLMEGRAPDVAGFVALGFLALVYLPAIAVWSALGHAFVTHPLLKAATEGIVIHDLAAAERARQRPHDAQAEAGGFADALGADIGGAI